ncbi:MAG TPA: penicillin-binding transpeptidase domain-containing protein [Anaeromyxobacteraceae bacterium]|nr:penicillin-binding transpeptidase domain-containing protein [Anaeromyxobacteraceae bacterium]
MPPALPRILLLASALLALGASAVQAPPRGDGGAAKAATPPATAAATAPAAPEAPLPALDLSALRLDRGSGRMVAPLGHGEATLTLDPRLQARLERFLRSYEVPWGSAVVLEPATGRILALAEHSQEEPGRRGLPVRALAPAASIFKIVTAAALLEQGVSPEEETCYHGGRHRLRPGLLADDPRRDRRCVSFAEAFGRSTNVVFAKLAGRALGADVLRAGAERFLFNVPLPFATPVEVSRAEIEDAPFALAAAAAGFGPVRLSPLHAALLAAVVANRGLLVPPVVVEPPDAAAAAAAPAPWRVVDERAGEILAEMMRRTVSDGTARRVFRRPPPSLRGVEVAGKTGSLAEREPYRDYSWFVGFAPVDRPEVAVAAVVANGRLWRVRAPTVAREALDAYFSGRLARAGEGRGAVAVSSR